MAHRILVVDDDAAAREGLRALLTRPGWQVEAAGDGQAALAQAQAVRPDVVLADLIMPRMDGLQLTQALQQVLPGVPIILLTGQGSVDTAVRAIQAGPPTI